MRASANQSTNAVEKNADIISSWSTREHSRHFFPPSSVSIIVAAASAKPCAPARIDQRKLHSVYSPRFLFHGRYSGMLAPLPFPPPLLGYFLGPPAVLLYHVGLLSLFFHSVSPLALFWYCTSTPALPHYSVSPISLFFHSVNPPTLLRCPVSLPSLYLPLGLFTADVSQLYYETLRHLRSLMNIRIHSTE